MYSLEDTIAAIATPVGLGGIGIVRLSGPQAGVLLRRLVFGPGRRSLSFTSHRLYHGFVYDPFDPAGRPVDEVLAAFMAAPRTYTRQDVAEISTHGGPVVLRTVLGLCLRLGARAAEPGEFTLRAFLNGRTSLEQAEAVLDVVQAKTEAGLRLAMEQLGGRLGQEIRGVRRDILHLLAYVTATIDFAEEEIPPEDPLPELQAAISRLRSLRQSADRGILYRQGVRVALVGRPNVGKSSLLNALLGINRAIVTPIPGTTRDTLEEMVALAGIPFVLVDTAGIRPVADLVEELGVERSRAALATADLVLLVTDGSEPLTDEDRRIVSQVAGRPTLLVINKSDLPSAAWGAGDLGLAPEMPLIRLSALTGAGLDRLQSAMVEMVMGGQATPGDLPLVSHPRHRDALDRSLQALQSAEMALERRLPADCVATDLTAAVAALGEITGETVTEDLLTTIFSRFCIGK